MKKIRLYLQILQAYIFNMNPLWEGFGDCERCHRKWSYVEGHATRYDHSSSMFPLCEACWKSLTNIERLPFYRSLWEKWKRNMALMRHNVKVGILIDAEHLRNKRVIKWNIIKRAVLYEH